MFRTLIFLTFLIAFTSCDLQEGSSSTYVKPSVDKNGRVRKGYVRRSVSTSKNAVKNQNRSKYYYNTRKKVR